jgi:hypothetical protein
MRRGWGRRAHAVPMHDAGTGRADRATARRPRRASRVAQHARSLLHQCRRRLPGAHRRRRIADRVYDRHRRRGAYLAAPGVVRLRRGTGPENPPRRAARSSTQCGFWIGRRSGKGHSRTCRQTAQSPGPRRHPHAAWPGAAVVAGVGGSASPVLRRVLRLARSAGQPPVCSVRAAGPRGVD